SCSVLRGYTAERSLWIDVLHRTQQTEMQPIAQPIAQPIRQDLSKLNLHDLQNGARQTYRLAKKLDGARTDAPVDTGGRVRWGRLRANYNSWHGPRSGHRKNGSTSGNPLACWNIHVDPAECCDSLDLGAHVVVESASFDEWGKVLLGAWDPSVNVHRLLVIRVDYRDLSAVSISLICSHDFDHRPRPEAWPTSHVSARRGTVSVVVADNMGSMYTLLTVSFDGSKKHIVPIRLPAHESLTGLTTQIVPSSNGPYLLRHIEPGNLGPPLAPAHRHTIIQLGLPASGMSDVDEDLPARPTSDILHISYSMHALEFSLPAPGEQPVFGPVAMRVPVERDAKCHIAAASPSGRYALVCRRQTGASVPLWLWRNKRRPSVGTRSGQYGSSDWWMAMDDNLGLVLALHGNGTLRIFSYT
ncbi:hypothetical protein B0H14DRAFT_2674459, partial [Mycena olivaceomarginata]